MEIKSYLKPVCLVQEMQEKTVICGSSTLGSGTGTVDWMLDPNPINL